MYRNKPRPLALSVLLTLTVAAVFTTVAFAGKPAKYPGSLSATPNTLHAGDSFTVSGCGYDTSLSNVIISFTGGSWGSALDANGCFSIAGIPALSGDTLPAGTYEVSAWQYSRGKLAETGETTITVVP